MLPIHLDPDHQNEPNLIEQLNKGAPTLWKIAMLCAAKAAQNWSANKDEEGTLPDSLAHFSIESSVILHLARRRGSLDVKIDKNAFESSDRILTVHVEVDDNIWQPCRVSRNIRKNVAFLESFISLCHNGAVLHHVSSEFTLTSHGFALADLVDAKTVGQEITNLVSIDK